MAAAGVGVAGEQVLLSADKAKRQDSGLELECQLLEMEEGPAWGWLRRGWIKRL